MSGHGDKKPRRTGRIVVGSSFCLLGVAFAAFATPKLCASVHAICTWLPVQATVLTGQVERIDSGEGFTYRPRITYRYEVAGVTYWSSRYDISETFSFDYKDTEMIVDRYIGDGQCTAYYDPHKPSNTVLERGVNWLFVMLLLFGALSFAIGLLGIVNPPMSRVSALLLGRAPDGSGRGIRAESQRSVLVVGAVVAGLFWGIPLLLLVGEVSNHGFSFSQWDLPMLLISFFVLVSMAIPVTRKAMSILR